MSNICHVVLNSEHKNWEKDFKKFFWPTYCHFLITYFYCHFKNVQPNWLDRSSWNFQDRQRDGFEDCSENFVPIWHLWPILQANEGRKWQKKYIICIFITTLKMSSQTGWTDRAETLSAVYKISSWSDTYGQFYRAIKAEKVQSNWLDPSRWIFQDRQRGGFERCIQNFFPIWHQ